MKSHRRRSHDQLANEMRVAFARDSPWLFLSLEQFSSGRELRQNANEVRIVFGRKVAQSMTVSILGTNSVHYKSRPTRQ